MCTCIQGPVSQRESFDGCNDKREVCSSREFTRSFVRADHPGQGLFLQWRPPRWMYPAATTKLEIVFQSCSTTKKRETLFQSCSTRSGDWHLHTRRLHLVSRELHIVINYPLANCHCHNSLPSMNDHDDNNDDDDSH